MASPTTNKGYTYPAHGGAVNAWDTPLNDNFDQIDLNVGGVYPITATTTTVAVTFNTSFGTVPSTATSITPNTSIAQNMAFRISGTISSTMTMLLPAAGGFYVIDNQTTAGTFKVNTTSGTSAVTIAAGGNNLIYTSSVNSNSANLVGQFQAKLYTQVGTPVSNVTPVSYASVSGGLTDAVWDYTNKELYVATSSQSSAWISVTNRVTPQGYLTLSTDSANPIISSDYASKTAVYYTPMNGDWTLLSNGTVTYPYQFTQLALSLTAAQAANNIYDVFIFNSTAGVLIGTGPAWATATAGSGARGTGAGTTQLARLNGVWTNAVQVTLTNGSTTFTCAANQGVYLGSLFMDATNAQVTCHRSYGQSRKWGVWNPYNRQGIVLSMGDATSSWGSSVGGSTGTYRPSNGSTSNTATFFNGLPEEQVDIRFVQVVSVDDASRAVGVGIAINSTNTPSGLVSRFSNITTAGSQQVSTLQAVHCTSPSLGINTATSIEGSSSTSNTFYGTNTNMLMTVTWRG